MTPRKIFSCGSRVLQLFCHKVEAANIIVVKNNWNDNFSDFIGLQGKRQVWNILSNFTKVAVFIPCIYIQLATFK